MNIFIEPIIMKKKKHDFKAWLKKKKVLKMANSTSPSLEMMIYIHEFLNILRNSYMYDNNNNFHLFIASCNTNKKYAASNNLAMVYKEAGFSFKFILEVDKNMINIEITRNGQNGSTKEVISFADGTYQFKDEYDKEKMLFITSSLMHGVVELIEYYYDNKRL